MHSLPPGRIGLKVLLADAEISKNTFFRNFRYDRTVAQLLDIQEDRDHRLHFPADAGHRLRAYRGKARHGNAGRSPGRPCPSCGAALHPRHTACIKCGRNLTRSNATVTPRHSTSVVNFKRREELKALRGEA